MIWDATQRRYEDDYGRPLGISQVKKVLDDFIIAWRTGSIWRLSRNTITLSY